MLALIYGEYRKDSLDEAAGNQVNKEIYRSGEGHTNLQALRDVIQAAECLRKMVPPQIFNYWREASSFGCLIMVDKQNSRSHEC